MPKVIRQITRLEELKRRDSELQEQCTNIKSRLDTVQNTPDDQSDALDVDSDSDGHLSDHLPGRPSTEIPENEDISNVLGYSTFSVALENEDETSYITGLCEIYDGLIALADATHMLIKVLNTDYEIVSYCNVPPTPLDVTYISENRTVAVAIDNTKDRFEVHSLSLTDNNCSVSLMFKVHHRCRSIAYCQGMFYICSDTSVYMYTPDGNLQQMFYENPKLLMRYVAISNDANIVYITDIIRHVVVTVTQSGCEMHNFGLVSPEGVCVNAKGQVFVCGLGSHNVVQVSRDGKRKECTVWRDKDRVLQPRALCFVKNGTTLLVSFARDDNLKAFTLSENA